MRWLWGWWPRLAFSGLCPSLVLLAVVVAALGTGQLIFQAAYRAWLPELTGEEQLPRATAALEAGDAASVLVGFPLAGALIAAVGPVIALGADAISYVASAGSVMLARASSRGGTSATDLGPRR